MMMTAYSIARYMLYRPSVRLSVSLYVTRVDQPKTAELRIMKFSSYGSPIPLVLQDKFCLEILKGFPRLRASNKGGMGKTNHFLALNVNV